MNELRPWFGRPPIAEPQDVPGFRLLRIEYLNIMRVSILGLVLSPIWFVLFAAVVATLGGQEGVSGTITLPNILLGLIALVGIIFVHEALHGAAIVAAGERPSFGAGPGFFYATCHEPLAWGAYVAVIVTPLIVINAAAVAAALLWPGVTGWALFVSLVNTMGAGGDLWMLARMLSAPRDGRVLDLANGFAVYQQAPDQATTASATDS